MIRCREFISLAITICTLIGCTGGDSFESSDAVDAEGLSGFGKTLSATTDQSGAASISFNVDPGTTSFQIVSTVESQGVIGLESLRAPSGAVVLDGETAEKATGDPLFGSELSVVNYPTLPNNPAVQAGTYVVTLLAAKNSKGNGLANVPVKITVIQKSDGDTQSGRLNLSVIFAGPVGNNRKSKDSIISALEKSGTVMQAAGISYSINYTERLDLPSILPNPLDSANSSFYESLSSDSAPRSITMVFGVDLKGRSSRYDRDYAITGSTPLPVINTGRSVICFSVYHLAGNISEFNYDGDGDTFDGHGQSFDDETLHMSTVISHEIGRALGLKNTVDFSGRKANDNDLLSDTPSCNSTSSCEIEGAANQNIMFPYAARLDNSNDFVVRDIITGQQRTIMNSSVLVE